MATQLFARKETKLRVILNRCYYWSNYQRLLRILCCQCSSTFYLSYKKQCVGLINFWFYLLHLKDQFFFYLFRYWVLILRVFIENNGYECLKII